MHAEVRRPEGIRLPDRGAVWRFNMSPGFPAPRRMRQAPQREPQRPLWGILTGGGETALTRDPLEAVQQDIRLNLATILNSRRGRCLGHPDFGMPDVGEYFVSLRGLAELGREIRRAIERCEPRIAPPVDVRIAHLPREAPEAAEGIFRATFVIRARLAPPWNQPCTFQTTMQVGGQAEVEG